MRRAIAALGAAVLGRGSLVRRAGMGSGSGRADRSVAYLNEPLRGEVLSLLDAQTI